MCPCVRHHAPTLSSAGGEGDTWRALPALAGRGRVLSGRRVTFEQLIDLWRKDRHPSTSELIERIGEKFDVTLSALPRKPKSDIARAWLVAVRAEPPSHLTARLEQLIHVATETSARVVWPVFEALEDLPADPRYATLAVRCLVGEVRVGLTTKLTRRLINCVEAHGDASHFELLQAHDAYVYDEAIDARLTRVIQKGLAAKPRGPELAEAEWSRLLAQDWKPGVIAPKQDPLLAVYAEPSDLGRRQVLADVLLEQGDPRGEFISLQLARASPKRQKTLLKQHGAKWLGRLQSLAEDAVFEDGFVAELTVNLALKLNQYLLTLDAPEWATVRRVRKGLQRLAPTMRDLRSTGVIDVGVLMQWGREAFPLPKLRSIDLGGDPAFIAKALVDLPTPVPWVSLRFWEYEPTRELRNGLAELVRVPGLERLRLRAFADDVVPRLLRELTLDWLPKTLELVEVLGRNGLVMTLARDGGGWALELFDDVRPHEASRWKELLFAVKGLRPTRVLLQFSSPSVPEDTLEAYRTRLADLQVEPQVVLSAVNLDLW